MTKGFHDYDTWRVDSVQCFAQKMLYEQLGLLVLAVVLHNVRKPTVVDLTHPKSDIRRLVLDPRELNQDVGGTRLRITAQEFEYWPSAVQRHPWLDEKPNPNCLPRFRLTNESDMIITDDDRASRDTVVGFGSLAGTSRFAELLLNISRPKNLITEFPLECEAGFRGVAPASCEMRLWLPGGDFWDSSFSTAGEG